jgi:hypothetical protein
VMRRRVPSLCFLEDVLFTRLCTVQKRMADFEMELQKHLVPLNIAQGTSAAAAATQRENRAVQRHEEAVDGLVRIHGAVAGPKGLHARFDAIDNEALAARKEHTEQYEQAQRNAHAHWQDLVTRSDTTIELIIRARDDVKVVGHSVREGRTENSAAFTSLHTRLQTQPAEVAQLVLEGLRAQHVSTDGGPKVGPR